MKWSEIKRKAIEGGFELYAHGSRHDLYRHKTTGKVIQIERHWSQEVRPGLMKQLKKEIGF